MAYGEWALVAAACIPLALREKEQGSDLLMRGRYVYVQHYAQCELLPRDGACSPDTSITQQFRQHLQNTEALAGQV